MFCPIKKPSESEAALFEQLVAMVQLAKREGLDVEATFLEELIDACVLELYFPEEAAAKDLQFMDKVSELLNVPQASSLPKSDSHGRQDACDTIAGIQTFVATANAPKHPIRNQLIRLTADSPNLFAVIKREGVV